MVAEQVVCLSFEVKKVVVEFIRVSKPIWPESNLAIGNTVTVFVSTINSHLREVSTVQGSLAVVHDLSTEFDLGRKVIGPVREELRVEGVQSIGRVVPVGCESETSGARELLSNLVASGSLVLSGCSVLFVYCPIQLYEEFEVVFIE